MSDSSNEPSVKMVGTSSLSKPWAIGPFYRRDGAKSTLSKPALHWTFVILFCVTGTWGLLAGPTEAPVKKVAEKIHIPLVSEAQPELPERAPTRVAASSAEASHSAAKSERKLPKLQVVSRPTSGQIPPGSLIKAKMLSGASNGPIRAQVMEAFAIEGDVRLEKGVILIGEGQSSEKRLFVRFKQAVHADGTVQDFVGQGCDQSDQVVGLKGERISGQALKLATGAALNFVGGLSQGLQDTEVQGGAERKPPTLKNALLNGAANAAIDQARDSMSTAHSEPLVIEVPAGTVFYVLAG